MPTSVSHTVVHDQYQQQQHIDDGTTAEGDTEWWRDDIYNLNRMKAQQQTSRLRSFFAQAVIGLLTTLFTHCIHP